MRNLWYAAVLLFLPVPCYGQEGKANTLTPAEAAEGWLLLFDGKTPFGWDVEGQSAVDAGTLVFGGKKTTLATFTTRFSSFELRLECRCEGEENGKLVVRRGAAVNSFPLERAVAGNAGWDTLKLKVEFNAAQGSETTDLDYVTAGAGMVRSQGTAQGVKGPAQLRIEAAKGTRLLLRNVKLRPLDLRPLFNGKDLSGWKAFPGKKSRFTVNAKGELNVKDGPGDLQTDGKYQDFVLQLDCRSNGKYLNSGVFFRCRAGEYQNGYETQIRNQFTAEPKQTYKIEECDPETRKVTIKEIKSTAVDYGTGAIYRRMPARLQASKDGTWFTLTVVAQGNHFATWVNGIQVVDFTDCRPPSDNARKGCCLNAGHISLQGHDPTTDLSFRNFRIAELPAAAR